MRRKGVRSTSNGRHGSFNCDDNRTDYMHQYCSDCVIFQSSGGRRMASKKAPLTRGSHAKRERLCGKLEEKGFNRT